MLDITYTITKISEVLPYVTMAFVLSLLLTPIVGRIARKIKAIDIPSHQRRRTDPTVKERLSQTAMPRLGGMAIIATFLIMLFYALGVNVFTVSLALGVMVLVVAGVLDDIYELHPALQFLSQIVAVLGLVLIGVRIEEITILGFHMDFNLWSQSFEIFDQIFYFVLPADLLTILWVLVIINAMNWVSGIDALQETMSIVAGVTLMLLSIKFGQPEMMVVTSVFIGSILGFWVFNFPPAYIISGTVGNTILGYLLAIFAIKIDGKMTTSILLLAVPLVDFIWVLVGRVVKFKVYNPVKLMSISGHHHLHHRLMELGYSAKQVLIIEITGFSFFAVAAYYFAGFNILAVAILGSFSVLMIFFAILTFKRRRKKKSPVEPDEPEEGGGSVEPAEVKQSPDQEYAY